MNSASLLPTAKHGTCNVEHGAWNTEYGTQNMECGTRNMEIRIWNMEHGRWNSTGLAMTSERVERISDDIMLDTTYLVGSKIDVIQVSFSA